MKEISVQNLIFQYVQGITILENINLTVSEGEFVCLLGQSGCGKSTFLRLLGGLETPTNGEIKMDNEKIVDTSLDRGIVFQDYGLFPWMTAGENIMLAISQKYPNKSKVEQKKLALEMLKKVDLNDAVFNKLPKELSGGMKQRCAIAQALSINSPILLMDEPFGALDAVTRAKLQDLILELWNADEKKKTVFFVTHDVDEAILLASRIIVFGQSPSNVIYDCLVEKDKNFSRLNQFKNEKMLNLRNELIELINKDITLRT